MNNTNARYTLYFVGWFGTPLDHTHFYTKREALNAYRKAAAAFQHKQLKPEISEVALYEGTDSDILRSTMIDFEVSYDH